MPTYRRTLTNREQREHESQLRWLAQAGLGVETAPVPAERSAIDVCIGYTENFLNIIFEHTTSLVLITGVRLVARKPGIRLADALFVTLPWGEDLDFDFLRMEKPGEYRIGREHFEEDLVINHQLPFDRPLVVGKPMEGLLIAQTWAAKLPTSYRLGDPVNAVVTFVDTLDRFYSAEGQLRVSAPSYAVPKVVPRRRSTLFDDETCASRTPQETALVPNTARVKPHFNTAATGGARSIYR